jgi:hypothetical protein
MPKKNATADELIWLFHEKLAGSNFPNTRIAIIPVGDGNWSALTNATERRHYPDLAMAVTRIKKQLRGRYGARTRAASLTPSTSRPTFYQLNSSPNLPNELHSQPPRFV